MTIYTRQYDEYGGIQAVLIVAPGDTGLLAGTLLDYDKRGKLVSISPNTPVTPLELDRSWTLMHETEDRRGAEADCTGWAGGCEHMGDGRVCGGCMGGLVG